MSLLPYTGVFGKEQLIHLLKRTTFGAKKRDMIAFSNNTLTETVDALLSPSAASLTPLPPVKNYYDPANNPDSEVLPGKTWVDTQDNARSNFRRSQSFRAWWYGLMLQQEATILEKMTLFWHNHFPDDMDERSAIMGYINNKTLRTNALGNFKTFVRIITLDPMMLRYLNGGANNVLAPDENYARELQELFTLGKGPNSKYTEDDVRAAARVLTGFQISPQVIGYPFQAVFSPTRHDTGDKQFSAFYNNRIVHGQLGADGAKELDDLLSMIFEQPEVSLFMCRKLYRFFVYYKIDEVVEHDVIEPLALIFRDANYELKPVLKALFTSAHFFDAAFKGAIIKSPIDYVVGLARECAVFLPQIDLMDFPSIQKAYEAWLSFHNDTNYGAAAQRQAVGNLPNVAGWDAYYQEPNYYRIWIDSETYPKRIKFGENMLNNTNWVKIELIEVAKQYDSVRQITSFINDVLIHFYSVSPSPTFKDRLRNILLSGQTDDHYWTDAWDAFVANPSVSNKSVVETRLKAFFQAVILRPEFHLM